MTIKCAKNYPMPIEMVGIRDKFGESGKPYELFEKFGLRSSFFNMGKEYAVGLVKNKIRVFINEKLDECLRSGGI